MTRMLLAAVATTMCLATPGLAQDQTPSPEGAQAYFINLKDGDTVSSPVLIAFGLAGMGVAPAGTEAENTGHHHLLINRAALGQGPDGADELIYGLPADDNHVHFGKGQTQVSLDLPAGTHTLQMVLGDMNHVPHNPPVTSQVITIVVE